MYGVSWISYLPQYSLTTIRVTGAKELSPELVETFVESRLFDGSRPFLSPYNIFLYPRAELERSITEYFPRIRTARISKETLLSQEIIVTIEERAPFARWCADACYFMDKDGFIFTQETASSTPPATRYVFTGALSEANSPLGQTFLAGTFPELVIFLRQLESANFSPSKISVENTKDFSVSFMRGFELRASFESDLKEVVRNLELVLSSDTLRGKEGALEYIDLRFGNRVYYKLEGVAAQNQ